MAAGAALVGPDCMGIREERLSEERLPRLRLSFSRKSLQSQARSFAALLSGMSASAAGRVPRAAPGPPRLLRRRRAAGGLQQAVRLLPERHHPYRRRPDRAGLRDVLRSAGARTFWGRAEGSAAGGGAPGQAAPFPLLCLLPALRLCGCYRCGRCRPGRCCCAPLTHDLSSASPSPTYTLQNPTLPSCASLSHCLLSASSPTP